MARTTNMYSSYSFRTKDPIIDYSRTALQDEARRRGISFKELLKEIHEKSDVGVGTMQAWYFGKTRRPQNPTMEAALRGAGLYRPIMPIPPRMKGFF